ncbi:unnamed protein product [Effrenium voratum]|nr:unnamed protein product [Effrenium voratum]
MGVPCRPPPGLELFGKVEEMPRRMEENCFEWTISNPGSKFKANCGCPLVSAPFSAGSLRDLRVIFAPGTLWASSQPKDAKKQKKDKADKKVWLKAPHFGSLQLKFGENPAVKQVTIFFQVNNIRLGPLTACPDHCTSQVCEFASDWRSLVNKSEGTLTVKVEVVG